MRAGLLDVGDRGVDLERLGDRFAALGAQLVAVETAKMGPMMTRLRISLWAPDPINPPYNEIETGRLRAYLILVIVLLVLRSSAIIFTVSRSSLLYPRLQRGGHNR